jgi:dTDP-4-amino-4,6-dideoxygalactose transaminase
MSKQRPFIPIAKPWIGETEAEAAKRAINSGWVTQGPEVKEFEQEFARYVGSDYACAVSSCTSALHLALLTVGVGPDHEVITVSHSYIATANSISYCGAKPIFIDIEPNTFNINPLLIEKYINVKTKAILAVHQLGMPCNLEAILAIAHRHNLPVIEDAACAVGSEIFWQGEWQKIGRPHSDIACFSFHPRKIITTGDGGMLTTNNSEWDKYFRLLRQHGMSVPDTVRHSSNQVIFESYPIIGYNYRMTDIQAAIGREQLKKLPLIVERRRYLANLYEQKLSEIKIFKLPKEPRWAKSNWQSFCLRLPDHFNQREIMQKMLNAGVSSRRGVMCAHNEEAYHSKDSYSQINNLEQINYVDGQNLFESENAQDKSIVLPLYYEMTSDDIDYVVNTLKDACFKI